MTTRHVADVSTTKLRKSVRQGPKKQTLDAASEHYKPCRPQTRAWLRQHALTIRWLEQSLHPSSNAVHRVEVGYAASEGSSSTSSARIAGDSRRVTLSDNQLRLRRVQRKQTQDERLELLKSILQPTPGWLPREDPADLEYVINNIIKLNSSDFRYNIEQKWSQMRFHLPSRQDYEIALPKPGHAISFALRSFIGERSVNRISEEQKYISPNGDDQCFPFLFLEVLNEDTQNAYLSNLHSASQALYNMHHFMVLTGGEELSFKIRVFSLVLNSCSRLTSARVHRAVKLPDGALGFRFAEILDGTTPWDYESLISAVLTNYATKELYLSLKLGIDKIIAQTI